ncbi:hypothetical protein SAMN05444266_104144 [Chitinophaga jiangningensis]|uniref:DUF2185 domain-containing protein n=1 Tax=Chitinophaga jiangningensis TaxID=1419482 RepID=A0A1M7BZZ5_9BACT|nr:DUF2185 domain-containing protein [Chitinophaga jiangningensis]SHL60618.1 hypothetical protein SAMN05444266_104144 [Chitinophaga jiangningensis]
MSASYYLQDIRKEASLHPRHFLAPSPEEIASLQVGNMVRLFFVFNFQTADNCRAERMWVEISEINGETFKGYLTNQPHYIQELHKGDVISFTGSQIATILVAPQFDENKKAIITLRALEKGEINWALCAEPDNPEDSGWQLFHGDEDDAYLGNPDHAALISLAEVLHFEPRLESVFASEHAAFEWDPSINDFVAVQDFDTPEE